MVCLCGVNGQSLSQLFRIVFCCMPLLEYSTAFFFGIHAAGSFLTHHPTRRAATQACPCSIYPTHALPPCQTHTPQRHRIFFQHRDILFHVPADASENAETQGCLRLLLRSTLPLLYRSLTDLDKGKGEADRGLRSLFGLLTSNRSKGVAPSSTPDKLCAWWLGGGKTQVSNTSVGSHGGAAAETTTNRGFCTVCRSRCISDTYFVLATHFSEFLRSQKTSPPLRKPTTPLPPGVLSTALTAHTATGGRGKPRQPLALCRCVPHSLAVLSNPWHCLQPKVEFNLRPCHLYYSLLICTFFCTSCCLRPYTLAKASGCGAHR
eukprot:TRINITY_DN59729_c0_g1_i1.p1 TRINITY_DN59729_c0_g1~~TRINITY_DN59729_c0_g1_i1.p1  ORF type:complete len:320 (-),score=-68.25 TRINITY_DN59729_c0_g1_i1:154-1113(-)